MPATLWLHTCTVLFTAWQSMFGALKATADMHFSSTLVLSAVYSDLSVSWHPCNMQFMYLQRPTKETRKRKMLRQLLLLLQLQHCRPQQVQLLRLQSLPLHPKEYYHQYPEMSSARSTSGCWKRSGRSNHATLLRRTKSMKRRLFLRSSFRQSLSLVCCDCTCCPAGLGCFFACSSSKDTFGIYLPC